MEHRIEFMLDAAIANASRSRGMKCEADENPKLQEALEAIEDAFDVAAEACRKALAAL